MCSDVKMNRYRGRLLVAHAAFRKHLIAGLVLADVGLAVAFDCYRIWEFSFLEADARQLTQAVTAGVRVSANRRIKVGLDLNLAREGRSDYYFSEEEPEPRTSYNA